MSPEPESPAGPRSGSPCCPYYHEAVELIGRRWTGAIVAVLLKREPLRFSQIAAAVPQLSDRLLSERMKELEARGLVARDVDEGPPLRVTYRLTDMGRALAPAVEELHSWAQAWLANEAAEPPAQGAPLA